MIYLFLLVWVPLFTYLAERQFKRVKEDKSIETDTKGFQSLKNTFNLLRKKSKNKKPPKNNEQIIKVLPENKKIKIEHDSKIDFIPVKFKHRNSYSDFDELSQPRKMIKIRFRENSENSFSSELFTYVEQNAEGVEPSIHKSRGRITKNVPHNSSPKTVQVPVNNSISREGIHIDRVLNVDGILDSEPQQKREANEETSEQIATPSDSTSAQKSKNLKYRKNLKFKFFGWMLIFVAIMPPSIVAGVKNYDVGGDISYVIGTMETVKTEPNFISYMDNDTYPNYGKEGTHHRTLEDGYKVFVYIVGQILSDSHFLLFIIQFITIALVALFAYKFRDKTNMTFVMAIYMLVWYIVSFTMMRQSLSIALILYSLTFFRKKQYIRTLILFLLAISLHISSIVAIGVYVLMFISQSNLKKKTKNIIYITGGILLFAGVVLFEPLMQFFSFTIPIIPDRYYLYMTTYRALEFDGDLSELIPRLLYVASAAIYIIIMKKRRSKIDMKFILMLLLIDLAFTLLNYKVNTIFRLGLYYLYPALFFLIPNLPYIAKHKNQRKYITLACVTFLFLLWLYKVPIKNDQSVFPYRSDILHLSVITNTSRIAKNEQHLLAVGKQDD